MRTPEKDALRLWLCRVAFVAMLALVVAIAKRADAGEVYVHGLSYHYHNRHDGMNEVNAGLSFKWRDDDGRTWHAGAYHNTDRRLSLFAMRSMEARRWGTTWGAGAGLVTGYEWPITPVAGVYAERGPLHLGVFPGVVAVSLQVNWSP